MHEMDIDGTIWKPVESRQGPIWRASIPGDFALEGIVSVSNPPLASTVMSVSVLSADGKRLAILNSGVARMATDAEALRILTAPALSFVDSLQAYRAGLH